MTKDRQTHLMRKITPIALYTKLDVRCDKLTTVVDRLLTTLPTVDVPLRNL